MAVMHTPEGYPEIYWLGLGSYEELSQACEEQYGIIPQEGMTTEELVQEIRNEGWTIPDEPTPVTICDTPIEQRREMLQNLLKLLENNDCEPCIQNINKQILEIVKCEPIDAEMQSIVNKNGEILNG